MTCCTCGDPSRSKSRAEETEPLHPHLLPGAPGHTHQQPSITCCEHSIHSYSPLTFSNRLILVSCSEPCDVQREQKIKDLSVLFINMHHLINEFRPHQARETLCVIMERQRKQREDMIIQVQRYYTITTASNALKVVAFPGSSVLKICRGKTFTR